MKLLSSDAILKQVENIIHEDTQLHANSVDLTIDSIYKLTKAGALDFGGSEFKPAQTQVISPKKKNKEDDYGWWELERGRYKAGFNEQLSLDENTLAILSPHAHVREAGVTANTHLITEGGPASMTFDVPEAGCNIKENARLAALHLVEECSN